MAKQVAQWNNKLSIFWLKKYGYLDGGWRCGGIKWTHGGGGESGISFNVTTGESGSDNIRLYYTNTDHWNGETENMDYQTELTTTPCRYGGKRYWFICPLTKNGRYCGRRVGILFKTGKWFGCRHCGDIAYATQMEGGKFRGTIVSIPTIERAVEDVKRPYYKGKPTRKYRRLMRLQERFERGISMSDIRMSNMLKSK